MQSKLEGARHTIDKLGTADTALSIKRSLHGSPCRRLSVATAVVSLDGVPNAWPASFSICQAAVTGAPVCIMNGYNVMG